MRRRTEPRQSTRAPHSGTGRRKGGGSERAGSGSGGAAFRPPATWRDRARAAPRPRRGFEPPDARTRESSGAAGVALWHLTPAALPSPGARVSHRRQEAGVFPGMRVAVLETLFPERSRSRCEGVGPLSDPEPDRPRCRGSAGAPGPPHSAGCVLTPLRGTLPRPDPQFIAQKTAPLPGELLTECDCVCLKAWLRRQTSTKFCSFQTRVLNAAVVSRATGSSVRGQAGPGRWGGLWCPLLLWCQLLLWCPLLLCPWHSPGGHSAVPG